MEIDRPEIVAEVKAASRVTVDLGKLFKLF